MEAKQVDFTKTLNDDQVYNCIVQNYEVLGTDWVKHQWNWLNGVYLSFEDHVKFLIIVSLVEKTLNFYHQVNITQNGKDSKDLGEVVLIAKNEIGYKNLLIDNSFSEQGFHKYKEHWSGRRDVNSRPLHPQRSALPDCATARPIARMQISKMLQSELSVNHLSSYFWKLGSGRHLIELFDTREQIYLHETVCQTVYFHTNYVIQYECNLYII